MVLSMNGLVVVLIGMKVKDFIEWPVETATSVQFVSNLTFPSLTICNMNLFRKSVLQEQPTLLSWVDLLYGETNDGNINRNMSDVQVQVTFFAF